MNDLVVARLDTANKALAEAKTIQETKRILDIAAAAKIYAQRQKLGEEAINYANAIKLEALRRLGEMLKETPKNHGTRGQLIGRSRTEPPIDQTPRLSDIGLDRKTSMLSQQIAELPAAQFESVKAGTVAVAKAIRDVRIARNRSEKISSLKEAERLGDLGKFAVLYCDPPWEYEHVKTESRAIENQYPTMSLEKICALPVGDIAMEDSVLFLWATSPKLLEAFKVLDSWGFTYRTCAVWDKEIIGMGYYFRQQHELLLVASRGNLPTPEPSSRPSSVIHSRREAHSKKPETVYGIIEKMYPEFSRVELFARQDKVGWKSWGNQ